MYNQINQCVESKIPESLLSGVGKIGKSLFNGEEKEFYFPSDRYFSNFPLIITGPSRAGKTSFIENLVCDQNSCCRKPLNSFMG